MSRYFCMAVIRVGGCLFSNYFFLNTGSNVLTEKSISGICSFTPLGKMLEAQRKTLRPPCHFFSDCHK